MFFKWICFVFIFFSSIILGSSDSVTFKKGSINLLIPPLWSIQKPIKQNSFVITHANLPATINISHHSFLEPVTANGLHNLRATTLYDGWMKVLARPASKKELLMANVNDSYLAVYIRQQLNDSLKLSEFLTAEYYFVADSYYYILNIETTKQSWQNVQSEWKLFLDNFWIGHGNRPTFHSLDISFHDWIQPGNFNNMNYIQTFPSIQRQITLDWELTITSNVDAHEIPIVTSGSHLFLIANHYLEKINSKSGERIWKFPLNDMINYNYLSSMNSLIFLMDTNSTSLLAISADTGEIAYTISVNLLKSPPSFTQDSIYLNDNGIIRKYAIESGLLIWSHSNFVFQDSPLFISEYYLIGHISTHEFVALDPENGSFAWKTKPCMLVLPPTCTKDILLAPIQEGNLNKKLIAFDLKNGAIKWSINKSILNLSFNDSISSTNDFSILSYSILNTNNERNYFLMRVDNKTGEIDWEHPISLNYSRPILNSSFIFSLNKTNHTMMILDAFTGQRLPNPSLIHPMTQFMIFNNSIIKLYFSNTILTIQSLS